MMTIQSKIKKEVFEVQLQLYPTKFKLLYNMASQRKQELLKELDVALNRKVQEKYHKNIKTQQLASTQGNGQYAADRYKKQGHGEMKQCRTKDNFARSPIVQKKSAEKEVSLALLKHQKMNDPEQYSHKNYQKGNEKVKSSHVVSPTTNREQQMESFIQKIKGQNLTLKKENHFLSAELSELKMSIKALQNQSQMLKREQNEYFSLKEENQMLRKELSRLKKKRQEQQIVPTKDNSLLNNLAFQEVLKNLMMQLNISFINKQWNQQFIHQSIISISKQINKITQQKHKLSSKLNKFDIDAVLTKENNVTYKQEIDKMRSMIQNYQEELEGCKTTISEMDQQFELMGTKNRQLEGKLRETSRELEMARKEIKIIMDSSKHRKPKRESSVVKKEPSAFVEESTIIKNVQNCYSQTEIEEKDQQKQEKNQNTLMKKQFEDEINSLQDKITKLQLNKVDLRQEIRIKLQEIDELSTKMSELEQQNLQDKQKLVELQEENYHFSSYTRQLQMKSQQINRDISSFMPQLKKMEEENSQLRQTNMHKDQQIINKLQIITQLRNSNEVLQEKVDALELELSKNKYEYEHQVKEKERVQEQLLLVSGKNSQLENSIFVAENQMKNQLESRIFQLQAIVSKKEHQINATKLQHQHEIHKMKREEDALRQELSVLKTDKNGEQDKNRILMQELQQFKTELTSKSSIFECEKVRLKQAIQQILIMNTELTKKQTQYEGIYHSLQSRILNYQSQGNQISQNYGQLEGNMRQIEKESQMLKNQNDQLRILNQELSSQVVRIKYENDALESESVNKQKMSAYYSKMSEEAKLMNQEYAMKLKKQEEEKVSRDQQIVELRLKNSQLEDRTVNLQNFLSSKKQQIQKIQQQLMMTNRQKITLATDIQTQRQQFIQSDKTKTEQISNQNYDIQRLIRQNKDLASKLSQNTNLFQSKQFQQSQNTHRITHLEEQNKSLSIKYQYLKEQLQMKQRNKDEDNYIMSLKNQQYCLLIKKILANVIVLGQLQHCGDIEELLGRGLEMIVEQKKSVRENQSIKKKEENNSRCSHNQYQLTFNHEAVNRNFHFGTQINSYEQIQLMSSRHKKQNNNDPIKSKQELPSPRSFQFSFSPRSPYFDPSERRTQRQITCQEQQKVIPETHQ